VNATIVKGAFSADRMWHPVIWKYWPQWRFRYILEDVVFVVPMLLSDLIDDVKSIDSRKNGHHEC
jgi:hypothetical protein